MQPDRDQIVEYLKTHNGIARVSMEWLRNHYEPEWERLSRGRADEIEAWCAENGILHDGKLSTRETEHAMLYLINSTIGHLVAAARQAGPFEGKPVMASLILLGHAEKLATQG